MLSLRFFLLLCLFILTPVFEQSATAQKYTVTDLGSLTDKTLGFESNISSKGLAINEKGWVTGYAAAPHEYGLTHAFLWRDGVMYDLGTLTPKGYTQGQSINNQGQIIGLAFLNYSKGSVQHSFLYSKGKTTDLGAMPDFPDTIARAINDNGDVVGTAGDFSKGHTYASSDQWHGFLWHNGIMSDLGTLPGAKTSNAFGINNSGQVTGESGGHIFLYDKGKMTDLGCLPGFKIIDLTISNQGEIVGRAISLTSTSTIDPYAFDERVVLYQNHTITDIGKPSDINIHNMEHVSINDRSEIVGTARYRSMASSGRGFLYVAGKWTDLNDLIGPKSGWTVEEASSINDMGQIVGSAVYFGPGKLNGVVHAVLLTPTK